MFFVEIDFKNIVTFIFHGSAKDIDLSTFRRWLSDNTIPVHFLITFYWDRHISLQRSVVDLLGVFKTNILWKQNFFYWAKFINTKPFHWLHEVVAGVHFHKSFSLNSRTVENDFFCTDFHYLCLRLIFS